MEEIEKNLVPVKKRVAQFRENYKDWALVTEIIEHTLDWSIVKCLVINKEGRTVSSGHSIQYKSTDSIREKGYLETAETIATGRALALLGILIEEEIASKEEVGLNSKKPKGVSTFHYLLGLVHNALANPGVPAPLRGKIERRLKGDDYDVISLQLWLSQLNDYGNVIQDNAGRGKIADIDKEISKAVDNPKK